jgi:aldehyde dehydrogenase (NAD+)
VKRVTLELGGKGPNIILDDADLDVAIDGSIFACMANNGQACEAGTRLLVPVLQRDEIVSRLVARIGTMRMGDPTELATDIGPVITAEQRDRVLERIQEAQTAGAKVAIGGGAPAGEEFAHGNWVEPTVLVDVTNDMAIAREEVFGPVLTVLTYETVAEAIAIANDTDYGLSAGVWGADEARTLDVARQLEAGMVYINDWHVIHPMYPFGGYKQSGLGREGGPDALDEYTEQKFISIDRSGGVENKAYALVLGTPS